MPLRKVKDSLTSTISSACPPTDPRLHHRHLCASYVPPCVWSPSGPEASASGSCALLYAANLRRFRATCMVKRPTSRASPKRRSIVGGASERRERAAQEGGAK